MLPPMPQHEEVVPSSVNSVRANDSDTAVDRSNPTRDSSRSEFDWVDPKFTSYFSLFRDSFSITSFIDRVCLLKPNVVDAILAIDSCHPVDTVCIGRAPSKLPFFFAYLCFFSDLHIAFSFDEFTMGVLQTLNVVPSQFHPNSLASLLAFGLTLHCILLIRISIN